MTSLPDYTLRIKMPLFSKARPRMTRSGHVYMASSYRALQAEMKKQLLAQWQDEPPLEGPLCVEMVLKGEARGDLDNIAGAFMDSGHNILWMDDRVSIISKLQVSWEKASKKDSEWFVSITKL
ncbi:MAG: RusA family crossover junction endodeoxyribonuclease [bacterium]